MYRTICTEADYVKAKEEMNTRQENEELKELISQGLLTEDFTEEQLISAVYKQIYGTDPPEGVVEETQKSYNAVSKKFQIECCLDYLLWL